MIDHIALAIGHGLLALALLRLALRDDLNADPLLEGLKAAARGRRAARRKARRRRERRRSDAASQEQR